MYVGDDFGPADPGEKEVYGFDFTAILATGETIASAAWTCSVVTGTDPSPSSRIFGSALIGPGKYGRASAATQQWFSGFLPGCQYRLQAMVTTSLGQALSLWSHVQCVSPA